MDDGVRALYTRRDALGLQPDAVTYNELLRAELAQTHADGCQQNVTR